MQSPSDAPSTRLRVVTIPDDHPYIEAVLPAGVQHVRLLPTGAAPWSPSPALDREVLGRLDADIDVLHVHFGYESLTVPQLQAWGRQTRSGHAALIVTVHDLRNPHSLDRRPHDAQLAALCAAADEVITLTAGAARELAATTRREATVLAHPTLYQGSESAADVTERPADVTEPTPVVAPVVGVHFKSLRLNVAEPGPLVRAVAAGARLAGARLRVDVHPDAVDRAEFAGVRAAAEAGELELVVHERFSDVGLERYLRELDVSVLPYRFGTHSGWLELCRDLGTAVVAPNCGYYREQWPAVAVYAQNEQDGLHADSLTAAVQVAVRQGRLDPADRVLRRVERDQIREAHAEIYRRALAARAGPAARWAVGSAS